MTLLSSTLGLVIPKYRTLSQWVIIYKQIIAARPISQKTKANRLSAITHINIKGIYMGGKNYYVSGQFNVTCDVCSKKIKASESRMRWDGFIVCSDDMEMRHPQDFVRARQDKISVPFTRPIPALVYTSVSYSLYVDDGYYINPPNQQYIQEQI